MLEFGQPIAQDSLLISEVDFVLRVYQMVEINQVFGIYLGFEFSQLRYSTDTWCSQLIGDTNSTRCLLSNYSTRLLKLAASSVLFPGIKFGKFNFNDHRAIYLKWKKRFIWNFLDFFRENESSTSKQINKKLVFLCKVSKLPTPFLYEMSLSGPPGCEKLYFLKKRFFSQSG